MHQKLVLIDSLFRQYDLASKHVAGAVFKPMLKRYGASIQYRAFRKVHLSSSLPLRRLWFADWEEDLKECDTVILADDGNSENVARYINHLCPDKRIIIWYRNSVAATVPPSKKVERFAEYWSFDLDDCKKYGLRYNPQFYVHNPHYEVREPAWDVFFVGQDKGRLQQLLDIEARLQSFGLTTHFCIVGYNSDYLTYREVIDNISRSKAILDIQARWQQGMTLRPLEALFYHKKLITNSRSFADSDIYDSANAFLLDCDSWSRIHDFVKAPYVSMPNQVNLIRKYGIEGWLARFDDPENEKDPEK